GTQSASVTVNVTPAAPPVVNLSASPNPVAPNTTTTLSWTTTNATSCSAAGGPWSGSKAVPNGSEVTAPITAITTFTLSCTGPGGSQSASVTVNLTSSTQNSLWSSSTTPAVPSQQDAQAAELGVKFKSDVNGSITAIRFYKGSQNTGTHTVSLWTSTGTLL